MFCTQVVFDCDFFSGANKPLSFYNFFLFVCRIRTYFLLNDLAPLIRVPFFVVERMLEMCELF